MTEPGQPAGTADKPHTLAICVNHRFGLDKPSCGARGGTKVAAALESGIARRNINVTVERVICFGLCQKGPNLRLVPGRPFEHGVTLEDVPRILDDLERLCGTGDGNAGPAAPGA